MMNMSFLAKKKLIKNWNSSIHHFWRKKSSSKIEIHQFIIFGWWTDGSSIHSLLQSIPKDLFLRRNGRLQLLEAIPTVPGLLPENIGREERILGAWFALCPTLKLSIGCVQGPSSSWDRDFLHVGQVAEKAFDVDFRSEIGEWRKDFFPEWRNGIMHQLMSALNPGVLLPSVGVLRSIPGGSVHGERANFTGLVLGCIEANFYK